MIRVAMLSFWHVHAKDYVKQAQANPATEIVAVWDELPERGRAQATALEVPFYENLPEVLSRSDIDAVIIDTPTNLHHDIMIAAAQAGKHIFTEKVIAPTAREVHEIQTAIAKASIVLSVSLPRLYHGYTLTVQDVLRRQLLGTITQTRVRLSHNGAIRTPDRPQGWLPAHFFNKEQCGGGALIDLGCHPMYLTYLFQGMPESVSANFGYVTEREVEDNAVVTLRYPNGSIGIAEVGFVNRFSPFTIEVHGTEGSLLYGTPEGRMLIRSSQLDEGKEWQDITSTIPADAPLAFTQWVKHIQQGTAATENVQVAVDLTTLMEAANTSAHTNQAVRLDSLPYATARS
ncbi:MAG TPA: Gfo/Idh/MocA family oxidoreductase [Dictyobacter sp.]|jgi:predicted dehydrogenase|nr:Gfo/Idh/MocA family oxidoreductase [Dictyobacter sp.]